MNKGVIIGIGGALALLGVALVARADEPAKPKYKKPADTVDVEEDSGQDVCDGYLAAIKVLKGQRAAYKAQLVDIDAELMNLYQNPETAMPEYVAQIEAAQKALKGAIASTDTQIELYQAQLEEECA